MSISKAMAFKGNNKFIVPCAGKMFRSSISKNDKALCFVLNKGYFETSDITSMLLILDDVNNMSDMVLVGSIDKVKETHGKVVMYRQRVFFKNIDTVLKLCKLLGLRFELGKDFRININNIMNCRDELVYLERYARRFNETIDDWLTNCCIIEVYYLLKANRMFSDMSKKVNKLLNKKEGYLYRAPFLVCSYSIDDRRSGIFLGYDEDKRLFKERATGTAILKLGYTVQNVDEDIKAGRLDEDKNCI